MPSFSFSFSGTKWYYWLSCLTIITVEVPEEGCRQVVFHKNNRIEEEWSKEGIDGSRIYQLVIIRTNQKVEPTEEGE